MPHPPRLRFHKAAEFLEPARVSRGSAQAHAVTLIVLVIVLLVPVSPSLTLNANIRWAVEPVALKVIERIRSRTMVGVALPLKVITRSLVPTPFCVRVPMVVVPNLTLLLPSTEKEPLNPSRLLALLPAV